MERYSAVVLLKMLAVFDLKTKTREDSQLLRVKLLCIVQSA